MKLGPSPIQEASVDKRQWKAHQNVFANSCPCPGSSAARPGLAVPWPAQAQAVLSAGKTLFCFHYLVIPDLLTSLPGLNLFPGSLFLIYHLT